MTTTANKAALPAGFSARVLAEGFGPGAWHGPDLKAALADVPALLAFRRPAPARHNIAEIALHHAFYQHSVRAKLTSAAIEPFVLEGEDWFEQAGKAGLGWPAIQALVADEQRKLESVAAAIEAGRAASPLSDEERFGLLLGITCHAVYHAGQIQLIKKLLA